MSENEANRLEPCPRCGALPCDWTENPQTRQPLPSADEIERVTQYLAKIANDVAWQAGVGGMETVGSFVSYLATNPERIPDFIQRGPLDLPFRWHVEGSLSWHGMDGKIHWPADIRKQDGRHEQ